jgi:hypothetical protein
MNNRGVVYFQTISVGISRCYNTLMRKIRGIRKLGEKSIKQKNSDPEDSG